MGATAYAFVPILNPERIASASGPSCPHSSIASLFLVAIYVEGSWPASCCPSPMFFLIVLALAQAPAPSPPVATSAVDVAAGAALAAGSYPVALVLTLGAFVLLQPLGPGALLALPIVVILPAAVVAGDLMWLQRDPTAIRWWAAATLGATALSASAGALFFAVTGLGSVDPTTEVVRYAALVGAPALVVGAIGGLAVAVCPPAEE
ncbi:MAG: hypothetical protein Q8O67_30880 [Deltaproteobacteria bacterium]|nr:hypothetical protein [Deltaproteobacteria bacterium]